MEQKFIEVDITPYTIDEIEKFVYELCQKLPLKVEGIKRYPLEETENGKRKERVSLLFNVIY